MQTEDPQRRTVRVQDGPVAGEEDNPARDRVEESSHLLLRVRELVLGLFERGDVPEADHDVQTTGRRGDRVELDQEDPVRPTLPLDQLHLGSVRLGLPYPLDVLPDGGFGEDREFELEERGTDQVAGGVDTDRVEEARVHHADLQILVQDQDGVAEAVEDLVQGNAPRRPVELLLAEPLHADIAALGEEFEILGSGLPVYPEALGDRQDRDAPWCVLLEQVDDPAEHLLMHGRVVRHEALPAPCREPPYGIPREVDGYYQPCRTSVFPTRHASAQSGPSFVDGDLQGTVKAVPTQLSIRRSR